MKAHIADVASKPLSSSQRKTPSERRSESFRKRLRHGAADPKWLDCDCRGCVDKPLCKKKIQFCGKYQWNVGKCCLCGKNVAYRWIDDKAWDRCTICNEGNKLKVPVYMQPATPAVEKPPEEIKHDYGEDYEGEDVGDDIE
jgi:hypothetical protein